MPVSKIDGLIRPVVYLENELAENKAFVYLSDKIRHHFVRLKCLFMKPSPNSAGNMQGG
jgi:hypothetical protein